MHYFAEKQGGGEVGLCSGFLFASDLFICIKHIFLYAAFSHEPIERQHSTCLSSQSEHVVRAQFLDDGANIRIYYYILLVSV